MIGELPPLNPDAVSARLLLGVILIALEAATPEEAMRRLVLGVTHVLQRTRAGLELDQADRDKLRRYLDSGA